MLNLDNLKRLIEKKYKNNMSLAAKDFGISKATLSRILNKKRGTGQQVLQKLIKYFNSNQIKIEDYIFLK